MQILQVRCKAAQPIKYSVLSMRHSAAVSACQLNNSNPAAWSIYFHLEVSSDNRGSKMNFILRDKQKKNLWPSWLEGSSQEATI